MKTPRSSCQAKPVVAAAIGAPRAVTLPASNICGVIAGETWPSSMSPIHIVGDIAAANLSIQTTDP